VTPEEQEAIRAQLERILATPQFRISRRYPNFLRHVVTRALEGRTEELKERTLGVEVFGRDPSYDTSADPVVRMTAGQVRRRLAQYYEEPGHENEIRIELPVGSDVPEVRKPPAPAEPEAAPAAPPPQKPENARAEETVSDDATAPPVAARRQPGIWKRFGILPYVAAGIALVAAGLLLVDAWKDSPLEEFWQPVWQSSDSVLICVGGGLPRAVSQNDPEKPPSILDIIRQHRVAWADALTLADLASFLRANGKTPIPLRAGETTLAELRRRPAVLIGGYNNEWILRFTRSLRFRYAWSLDSSIYYIEDQQNPAQRWAIDAEAPHSSFNEDYGIVTRYFEPATRQYIVVASGIAYYGTLASREFLTDARSMALLAAAAPKGWQAKNVQAVFSTRIINGETGPPRILAVHCW